jgi:hypothetical protein
MMDKNSFFLRFPQTIRYGMIAGICSSILASIISFAYGTVSSGTTALADFLSPSSQIDIITTFVLIQIGTSIIWLPICVSIAAFLIPEQEKRLNQTKLFFSNALASILVFLLSTAFIFILLLMLFILL